MSILNKTLSANYREKESAEKLVNLFFRASSRNSRLLASRRFKFWPPATCKAGIILPVFFLLCLPFSALAQDFLNSDVQVTLMPASEINTRHLEFAPMYYGSGIVFVHAKEQEKQVIDLRLGMPFYELMYAELGPDGLPGKPATFSPNIRTRFHEGPTCFTNDLQQVFFTRQNTNNGQNVEVNNQTNLKIYIADKGVEDWENQRELPFCSDEYSVQCPTLSPDNQQIVFMSDMPGGLGGWDLYISNRYSGSWSAPVNLGPAINSAKYERLPFWHERGVLFFASDRPGGSGGLDLYAARIGEDGIFSAPVNLGPNFNSRQDDLSFICDKEGMTGYFASSRKQSLGKDDIFYFKSDHSIFSTSLLEESLFVSMSLAIRDESTLQPVQETGVWIFPIGPTGAEGLTDYFDRTVIQNDEGNDVIVLVPKNGIDLSNAPYTSDIKGMIPVQLNPKQDYLVVLLAQGYHQRDVVIPRASIHKGNEYMLGLLQKQPDPLAPLTPNKDCIPVGALVLGATSQTELLGVLVQVRSSCTGTIQVMETDAEGRFRTCLVPGCDYQMRFLKSGYLEQNYKLIPGTDPNDRIVYMLEADLEARTEGPPEVGDVLVLENIYYDFNKSAIRTGDTRELESLAQMMLKYSAMTIELQSHTDARGSDDYNMELATRRGESVRDFLVLRGVTTDRVHLKPMGESQLRNHCKDGVTCTDEEHQKNRRTEIKILTVDPKLEVRYSGQQR